MYNDMTNSEVLELEMLIDKYSLARVVGTLACIANEKAYHILVTYSDTKTSAPWRKACHVLDKTCTSMTRLFVAR